MTADDWKVAETKLTPFGYAEFLIDGYNVSVALRPQSKTKFVYMVFVDGIFKGEWLIKDCEIRRRFCYEGKKSILTGKQKADFIKQFGKREYNRFIKENSKMMNYKYYLPYFGSFRTLKSHFIKNNESITLVK
ncbi:MAG: hypothetical protein ACI4I2_04810 [Oscillospiraceae bacterium]